MATRRYEASVFNQLVREAVEIGEGEKKLTQMEVANVPSWIINSSNEKLSIENEISHVFLYITERENYFIGWDFEGTDLDGSGDLLG